MKTIIETKDFYQSPLILPAFLVKKEEPGIVMTDEKKKPS
jgi:hypothetical protein